MDPGASELDQARGEAHSLAGDAVRSSVALLAQTPHLLKPQTSPPAVSADTTTKLATRLAVIESRCIELSLILKPRSAEGREFRELCSVAFDIRCAIPLTGPCEKSVRHAVTMLCLAVIGDRIEDARDYLNEHRWPIPDTDPRHTDWITHCFFRIADGFLRLVRNPDKHTARTIASVFSLLEANKKRFEPAYIRQLNGFRHVAAIKLLSLTFLMMGVRSISEGKPGNVDYFLKAAKASDAAGDVGLTTLIRWMSLAAERIK